MNHWTQLTLTRRGAAAAAVLRLSPVPAWEFAARATSGRLLAPAARGGR